MPDGRPVLLGQCNPLSDSPLMALWTDPPGCTGWRLWQMVGGTQEAYIRGFDRRNMVSGRMFNFAAAKAAAPKIWRSLEGRRVILLGTGVRMALRLDATRWLLPHRDDTGREWRVVPHPSGSNRLYNDPTMGLRVSMLLRDWLENYGNG